MSNDCGCPEPPGGRISCEEHQVPICRVVSGRAHTRCYTPPPRANEEYGEAANWLVSVFTNELRSQLLEERRYVGYDLEQHNRRIIEELEENGLLSDVELLGAFARGEIRWLIDGEELKLVFRLPNIMYALFQAEFPRIFPYREEGNDDRRPSF